MRISRFAQGYLADRSVDNEHDGDKYDDLETVTTCHKSEKVLDARPEWFHEVDF